MPPGLIKHPGGFFITFEGIDGSGKSTQCAMLSDYLRNMGLETVLTKEPGDWSQGPKIREILLEGDISHSLTELYLFMADRCEHTAQVLTPALSAGKWVICDRYMDSTLAYQCFGRGLDLEKVQDLMAFSGFPIPDRTIFLSLPISKARERLLSRSMEDRIEKNQDLMEKVSKGFLELMKKDGRILKVDGTGTKRQVFSRVLGALRELIP